MQDSEELIAMLNIIDPKKPYGQALFNALARLTISVACEAVCLRFDKQTQRVQVYLTQRTLQETAYPGEWHCPGSFYRPRETEDDVFDRLAKKEFGANFLSREFVTNVKWHESRGDVISMVYLCVLEDNNDALKGRWFPVDQLPEKTVECHRTKIIPAAVESFVAKSGL